MNVECPPRVLLDVGAAQSRLVIGRGDVVRVVKTIDVGADHVRTAISRKMGFSIDEAEQMRRRSEKHEGVRKVLGNFLRPPAGKATGDPGPSVFPSRAASRPA